MKNIRIVDDDRVIVLEFIKRNYEYEAGQYVFMRVGKIGFFEWHPFSISSHPDQDTICIHIKVNQGGRWTRALCQLLKRTKKIEMEKAAKVNRQKKRQCTMNASHDDLNVEWWKKIKIQIEGSHGYLTLRKPLHEYQHIIFIGGGIGITPLHSLFNQLVSDLSKSQDKFKNAEVKHIEFIFTTRSKAMITEFARKNKAWEYGENENEDKLKENNLVATTTTTPASPSDLDEDILLNFNSNPKRDKFPDIEDIEQKAEDAAISMIFMETGGDSTKFRNNPYASDQGESPTKNMALSKDDILVNAASTIIFERGNRTDTEEVEQSLDEYEMIMKKNSTIRSMNEMAVESFDIKCSTHITVVKDETMRMFYQTAYPFIKFKRPNIRQILYRAASISPITEIVVLTSGPKSMIHDVRKWGNELGIDIHFEIFDW